MHVKITASGPRRYVQLVESFRDAEGLIRKRTVATLGRLDQVGDSLDAVIDGLLKATGRNPVLGDAPTPDVSFDSARALGSVWALNELWKILGFDGLRRTFRPTCGSRKRERIDSIAHSRVMVDPVLHDPVDLVHSETVDDVRPIAVVVAGRERGATAPVVHVPEVGAQVTYPTGKSAALVRHVKAVVGVARCSVLFPAQDRNDLAEKAI